MKQTFQIIPVQNIEKNTILLHEDIIKWDEQITNITRISFGQKSVNAKVHTSPAVTNNEIGISSDLYQTLHIPKYVEYEVKIQQENLLIGPYIGLLVSSTIDELYKKKEKLNDYIKYYGEINGCILAFSAEGINRRTQKVKGLMYNPKTNTWVEEIYPYPSVVIKQNVYLSKKKRNYLQSTFGNKFINNRSFNKWLMYSWLNKQPILKDHLPFTALYNEPSDILSFLQKFNECYVKPLSGMKGGNIKKISKENNEYIIKSRSKKVNNIKTLSTDQELLTFCKEVFTPKKHIIQEPIDLEILDNHAIDFRLFLQKNEIGQWRNIGILSRFGYSESIVSNYARGGKVALGKEFLKEELHFSDQVVHDIEQKMTEIAITAAEAIEKNNVNINKYGIDLAIDQQQKVWLIEMNHRFVNDNVFHLIGDYEKVSIIRMHTLLYGKFVAGFSTIGVNK
jgi:glutathione synthase/RimK-type ligase-like ATP-grasp enzyme